MKGFSLIFNGLHYSVLAFDYIELIRKTRHGLFGMRTNTSGHSFQTLLPSMLLQTDHNMNWTVCLASVELKHKKKIVSTTIVQKSLEKSTLNFI